MKDVCPNNKADPVDRVTASESLGCCESGRSPVAPTDIISVCQSDILPFCFSIALWKFYAALNVRCFCSFTFDISMLHQQNKKIFFLLVLNKYKNNCITNVSNMFIL